MLNKELQKRELPDVLTFFNGTKVANHLDWELRREEILNCFQTEMYGRLPAPPISVNFNEESCRENLFAGKAFLKKIVITSTLENGAFSFPIDAFIPKSNIKHAFVFIGFKDSNVDRYFPAEELVDNGCAIFHVYCEDITSDDDDFTNGLAGVIYHNKKRGPSDAGKIMLWAWGLMRIRDYIETLECIDKNNVCVIGHSRLGKTSLLAAALDKRFSTAAPINSGCCGAAIQRGNTGEQFSDIYSEFPFWFCENFKQYAENYTKFPMDMHALVASLAPRKVYIASAELDPWADPRSEFLSGIAASDVYTLLGAKGLVHNNRFPEAFEELHEGKIGYHIRHGCHYLNRTDWLSCLDFLSKQS